MSLLFDNTNINYNVKTIKINDYEVNFYFNQLENEEEINTFAEKNINYYEDFKTFVMFLFLNLNFLIENKIINYVEIKNKNNWCICHFLTKLQFRFLYYEEKEQTFLIYSFFLFSKLDIKIINILSSCLNYSFSYPYLYVYVPYIKYSNYLDENDKYKLYLQNVPQSFQEYILSNKDKLKNIEIE